MRTQHLHNEIKEFDERRKQLIFMEVDFTKNHANSTEAKQKLKELVEKNKNIAEQDDVMQQVQDHISSKFRLLVIILDYFLIFTILANLSEHLPYIPIWLKALIAVAVYTALEYIISLFHKEDQLPPTEEHRDSPFLFDENYERKLVQHKQVQNRNKLVRIFRHIFISVLPLLSLAIMFQELDILSMRNSLMEGENMANNSMGTGAFAIVFKYLILAMCSYVAHFFLVEYAHKIHEAKARLKFQKQQKKMEDEIQKLKEKIERVKAMILNALLDYRNKLKMHIARFGEHDLLPTENFSPMLNKLYAKVNGL